MIEPLLVYAVAAVAWCGDALAHFCNTSVYNAVAWYEFFSRCTIYQMFAGYGCLLEFIACPRAGTGAGVARGRIAAFEWLLFLGGVRMAL